MKVFNIGFNKSGTTSLTRAVEELGYRTVHFMHGDDRLVDIMRGNYDLGRKLLHGIEQYDFYSDFAGQFLFRLLDHQYPGSKFILTIRDQEDWLGSVERHMMRNRKKPGYKYAFKEFDREGMIRYRTEYLRTLEQHFEGRSRDYLIINVVGGEGWERLCPFLGTPVPPAPFPRLNAAPSPGPAPADSTD